MPSTYPHHIYRRPRLCRRRDLQVEARQWRVDQAVDIAGGKDLVGEAWLADAADYVAGRITVDEMVARIHARLGLE